MPKRKIHKSQKKPKRIPSGDVFKIGNFSKANLVIFALVFAAIGGYIIYSSFAATPTTANLWVNSSAAGSCTRSSTPLTYAQASTAPSKVCSSFQTAVNATQNGSADTIIVKSGGSYSASLSNVSRSPAVTIYAENGGTSILNGGGFVGVNGVTIDGTGGTNGQGFIESGPGGDYTFSSNGGAAATNIQLKGIRTRGEIFMINCSNILIDHVEIYNKTDGEDSIQMSTWGDFTHSCNNVTFDHMYIHDISCPGTNGDHLDFIQVLAGHDIAVKNSRMIGMTCHTVSGAASGSQGWFMSGGFDRANFYNMTLENTVIANLDPLGGGEPVALYESDGVRMVNNTLDGNIKTEVSSATPTDVTFRNNLVNSPCAGINILFNNQKSSGSYSNNVTTTNCGHSAQGDTVTSDFDANFVNPSTGDYHLKSGAFAISKGTANDAPAIDLDGNVRDANPDAGAYEFGASPPNTTANLWVDGTANSNSCARHATSVTYTQGGVGDTDACSSIDAAWDACQPGDIIMIKASSTSYGSQTITGNKVSPGCTIIGESTSPGVTIGDLNTDGNYITIKDLDVNVGDVKSQGWSSAGSFVTLDNVNILGGQPYVNLKGNMSNITWRNGIFGGKHGVARACPNDEPFDIYGVSYVTIENITVWDQHILTPGTDPNCGGTDNTFHMETFRIDQGAHHITFKNNYLMDGDQAGTARFFVTEYPEGSGEPHDITWQNNYIGALAPGAGSYSVGFRGGSISQCLNMNFLYNTWNDGIDFSCTSSSGVNVIGNAGFMPTNQCWGNLHSKNVWDWWDGPTPSGCSADKWIDVPVDSNDQNNVYRPKEWLKFDSTGHITDASSPLINGGETNCAPTLGSPSFDIDNDTRPVGPSCDAGADEYTGTVTPPPPPPPPTVTATISANPTFVNSGGSSTLTWSSTNATSCTASGGWSGSKATSGTQSTGALSTATTYNLSCTDGTNTANSSTTVAISVPVSQTPMATYNFNEGTGTTAADSSGNNLNLTMSSSSAWTATGKNSKAASFNGSTSAQRADDPKLFLTTGTLEAWVKINGTTPNNWHSIIAKGNSGSDPTHNYGLEINNNNQLVCILGNNTTSQAVTSTATITGTTSWYHTACTWDGTNVKIYINGALDKSVAQSLTPATNTSPLFIGQYGGNVDPANASIDDVRIYNKALTIGELATDMNTAVGSTTTPKPGDINNDGAVNIADLSFLLSSYGQATTQCVTNTAYKCDLSTPADNIVNIFDLSILLSAYGR